MVTGIIYLEHRCSKKGIQLKLNTHFEVSLINTILNYLEIIKMSDLIESATGIVGDLQERLTD